MYKWADETRLVWYAISGRTVWWHERCTDTGAEFPIYREPYWVETMENSGCPNCDLRLEDEDLFSGKAIKDWQSHLFRFNNILNGPRYSKEQKLKLK